ncbi:MAG: hypothetical protein SPH62_01845 [Candidatus Egerieousia sp.]|nr:hypothetical protein [bacterium]MDY5255139.1 hypothetical protein [Candidatus Egerieousia sp.]
MNITLRSIIKRATLATVALLLSFGIAGAQMDLRISKSKIKSSLKRLDQLELLAAQLNTASGSTQAAATPNTAQEATTAAAAPAAAASTQAAADQLCQIAKQCKELSESISHYINQVSVLSTLQASSEKVLQRTLLLTKLDSLSKELASHKESISSIGSSIMSTGASSKALKSIGAKILKVAEKEYLYQAMAIGNMISALGTMK